MRVPCRRVGVVTEVAPGSEDLSSNPVCNIIKAILPLKEFLYILSLSPTCMYVYIWVYVCMHVCI
jgi:hypothetical protein